MSVQCWGFQSWSHCILKISVQIVIEVIKDRFFFREFYNFVSLFEVTSSEMHLKISVQICNRRLVTLSVLLEGINHSRGPLHELSSGVFHFEDSRSDCNNICLFVKSAFLQGIVNPWASLKESSNSSFWRFQIRLQQYMSLCQVSLSSRNR